MNDRDFASHLVWMVNSPVLALDTETTGLFPHEWDHVLGICVANEFNAAYFPLRHTDQSLTYDQARTLIEVISTRRERILFHNAIFDWAFLRKESWTYPEPWRDTWDTMVARWLLDENAPKSLEECIGDYGLFGFDGFQRSKAQKERQKRVKKIGWDKATYADIRDYATWDARNTYDLYLVEQTYFKDNPDLVVALEREMRFLGVCDEMISTGISIDLESANKKLHECDTGIALIEDCYPGVNFDSPKQLGDLIYSDEGWGIAPTSFTRTGQPATDKDTLLKLLEFEPRIQDIFDHRKLRKARSTYYEPMVERIGRDGRIHAWYRPHGTKTGRLSCSQPNLQTLPHDSTLPGVKECFIAAEGYELWEYDISQAELRVASWYADDFILKEHLESGDVHSSTAVAMFGDAEGIHRNIAKNLNFASLYGVGAKKFITTTRGLDLTEDQARQFLGQWRALYQRVTEAADDAKQIAEERGYVRLWPQGRVRRFDTSHAAFENPKDAFNAIVQGGVGEYVKQLMLALREPARQMGVRLCLNVHDSIVCEVPQDSTIVERWTQTVKLVGAQVNPFVGMPLPIGVKRW